MLMAERMKKISHLLNGAYGKPLPRRRSDPVDELIRTILSQNTNDKNSLAAFAILKAKFKPWERLLKSDVKSIASAIKHAGLANIKALRIKEVLDEIKTREGRLSLSRLGRSSVEDALEYLRSLKGVGPKTASCVMLFSFGKPVMPVDTHIFRVAKRLGLIPQDMDVAAAHKCFTDMTPKHLIYNLHLGIIEHGRRTCKAENPRCGSCVLYGMCAFKLKKLYRDRCDGDKKSHG